MVRLAGWTSLLLCAVACGGNTQPGASRGGSDDGGAGAVGGSVSQGGTQNVAGAAAVSGMRLPGATEQEEEVLAPLFVETDVLGQVEFDELVGWAAKVALARGYAMCRCVTSAAQPPSNVDFLLTGCARDEGGELRNFLWYPSAEQGPRPNQDLAQCLADAPAASPWLADALRCELERYQRNGQDWLELCAISGYAGDSEAWPSSAPPCADTERFQKLLEDCLFVGYCDDGTRMALARCDETLECVDASDERGCFEVIGNDMVQCGNEIQRPMSLCDRTECGSQTSPPLCDPDRPDRFLCADGTDIPIALACNRTADCPDSADEQHCLL